MQLLLLSLVLLMSANVLEARLPIHVPVNKADYRGPIWRYVYTEDDTYHFEEYYNNTDYPGVTTYVINMTSQTWFDETLSDRPVWWHDLIIHIPDERDPRYIDAAFMQISGSSNTGSGPPSMGSEKIARTREFALEMKAITAVLRQVPNQPIVFENRTRELTEDSIISWTWKRVFNLTKENTFVPDMLLRAPMIKACARAVDTIQAYIPTKVAAPNSVSRFIIAGESKRGWTTWMFGAFDDRIVAMAPEVLSCLNLYPNFMHYYQSFGGWPLAMADYWLRGIMGNMKEPGMILTLNLVDPFTYRKWMTMPILMISAASDEFFLIDDSHYFYSDLPSRSKNIWIMEDTGHCINCGRCTNLWQVLQLFFAASLYPDVQKPQFNYTIGNTETGGSISVTVDQSFTLKNITVWSAMSIVPDRRDWRIQIIQETGIKWLEEPMDDEGDGTYSIYFDNPEPGAGFKAFFVKLRFEGVNNKDWILTTEANVIPNTLPYSPCEGPLQCQGRLY